MLEQYFLHPEFLWLIPALLPIAIWDGVRRWGGSRMRQVTSVLLRFVLLSAMIVGLAQPQRVFTERNSYVVVVVDGSASIPDNLLDDAFRQASEIAHAPVEGQHTGLILFDSRPNVLVYPGDPWPESFPVQSAEERPQHTNFATAISTAVGLIPDGVSGRVVLMTDGQATEGNLEQALRLAVERGVSVEAVAIESQFADPGVADIALDREAFRPGETISGEVVLTGGGEEATGVVMVRLGTTEVLSAPVTLPAGQETRVPFEYIGEDDVELAPGLQQLRAEWIPDAGVGDARTANNLSQTGVNVLPPTRVLAIGDELEEVESLSEQLRAEEMAVDMVTTGQFAAGDYDFDDYDLVILGNVPVLLPEGETGPRLTEERVHD
ncbi:MAG: VWA domain-containing protein, partial [Myxococcales bacterium]|nr:VWA domain-containing protein [Myxococcales bacterium]